MGDLPPAMRDRWPYYPLSIKGSARGNMDYMEFNDLDIALPTAFYAKADGFVANVTDPKRLRADVQFNAKTQNLDFVKAMMPRDVQRNYRIPPMSAEGRVKADGAQYMADITAREAGGVVKVKGNLNADTAKYLANGLLVTTYHNAGGCQNQPAALWTSESDEYDSAGRGS